MTSTRSTAARIGLALAGALAIQAGALAQQPSTELLAPQLFPSREYTAKDLARMERWLQVWMDQQWAEPDPYSAFMGSSMTTWTRLPGMNGIQARAWFPTASGFYAFLRVYVPSTQIAEAFSLYVPNAPTGAERPLLTCFHSYSRSNLEIRADTHYLAEAQNRDWFLLAPLQHGGLRVPPNGPPLWSRNYGSAQSQDHVEAAIRFVREHYAIDLDRLYGVGFSMGGGSVMSYAARHRDRDEGAFAAVLNHTGTVALSHTYANVTGEPVLVMRDIFGGDPAQRPFAWTRASSIVLDGAGNVVPGADHMAVNLSNTPVRSVYNPNDPLGYLVEQTVALDAFFQGIQGSLHELAPVAPTTSCLASGGAGHCWDTANETAVCSWLEMHSLDSNPTSGTVLADRSARWGQFDLEQTVPDSFSRLHFVVDVPANRLRITGAENVKSLGFALEDLGLDPTRQYTLEVATTDPGGVGLVVRSVAGLPASVWRNGPFSSVVQDCSGSTAVPSWCYNAGGQELLIFETGGPVVHSWQIQP